MTQVRFGATKLQQFFCLVAGLLILLGAASRLQARPLVERVSFTERSDGQGYVIRFRTTQQINAYHDPRQVGEGGLSFTLYNAGLAAGYAQEKPQGPVQKYTVKSHGGHLTFHFELEDASSVEAAAYRDRTSSDLLLNLSYGGAPARASEESSSPPTVSASSREEGSNGARWKLDTVVIDAGHGGRDPGAQAYGISEKDVVLSIARKLGAYIEQKTAMDVVYTRRHDRFVKLRERGRIANKAGAKLFISIHSNAARNRRAHGTETYFLGMHKTETARRVMERENSVIKLEENPDQYQSFGDSPIMQSLAQSAYMRKSEQLASLLQEQFEDRVGRKNRGVKQAGFLVLWAASMPAILVETGFLTNASEAAFLSSDKGQTYIASAIFRAVREYKKQYEKGLDLAARD